MHAYLLYALLTALLAVIAARLYLLNSRLRQLAEEKLAIPPAPAVPSYGNKAWLLPVLKLLFLLLCYGLVRLAI